MDALSDVLRAARLGGAVFLNAEFSAPWCIAARAAPEMCAPFLGAVTHLIPFHYVVEGSFAVALEGGPQSSLGAGEVILFPRNELHFMGSDLTLRPVGIGELLAQGGNPRLPTVRHGEGGAVTRLVCGYLACELAKGNPVLESLPGVISLRLEDAGQAEWIRSTFRFAASEIAAGRVGYETVVAKLAELLFVEAVRRYAEQLAPQGTGWFAGLRDPFVARALACLHNDVRRAWTVDDLGREAGLSRSALADRFTRLIGVPPMQYLASWRMHVAAQTLSTSTLPLARVAERVGYESEAAFSRAFRKSYGKAPASWRRERR